MQQRQVAFFWRGEGTDVRITGSFTAWSAEGLPMERESPSLFSILLPLRVHTRVQYKFIVDGAWQVDESSPMVVDALGNTNNEMLVAELFVPSPVRPPRQAAVEGAGSEACDSAVGTPMYAGACEESGPIPVGSLLLSSVAALDTTSTSYIGAGVLREYTEEYELDAVRYGAQKRALTRSVSMSQLDRFPNLPAMLRQSAGGGGGDATLQGSHHRLSFHASTAADGGALDTSGSVTPRSGAGAAEAAAALLTSARGSSSSLLPLHATTGRDSLAAAAAAAAAATPAAPGSGGSSGTTSGAITPREGVEGPKSVRPKLSTAMNRTVGVPTSVSVTGESFVLGISSSSSGGSGSGEPTASTSASGGGAGPGNVSPSTSSASSAASAFPPAPPPALPSLAATTAAAMAPLAAGGLPPLAGISSLAMGPATAQPTLQAPLSHVQALLRVEGKLVVAMAGLPARGKTFIARHLKRHLGWMGYRTEIFNVGNYRRKHLGARQSHDFFDPQNKEGEAQRHHVAALAFTEMAAYLRKDEVDVAIFDATNTTVERRQWLIASLAAAEPTCRLVFVEPICNDEAIIRSNVVETKLKSPDYKGMEEGTAVGDFLARIQHYVSVYQPLGEQPVEENVPYIKLIDLGKQFVCNRVTGYLNSRVMFFLFNLHVTSRPIWLTRHGESEFNVQGRIGGDSGLSLRGSAYAQRLAAFFNKHYPLGGEKELVIWTSTLRRTQLTAAHLGRKIVAWKALDEIDAGICDSMTYESIAAKWPEEYSQRSKSKFTYRYPRGESYADIVLRLEPLMVELVRQRTPVLIISHQATLRVLYAYLTDMNPASCPEVLVPLHTVLQLTPKAYSAEEVRHELLPAEGGGGGGGHHK